MVLHRGRGARVGMAALETVAAPSRRSSCTKGQGETPRRLWRSNHPSVVAAWLGGGADPESRHPFGERSVELAAKSPKLHGTEVCWRLNDTRFRAPLVAPEVVTREDRCAFERESSQNHPSGRSDCNRVMVLQTAIPFAVMTDPQPSAGAATDPRTVDRALELIERTADRRRRCRRCRSVIAENARERGEAWWVGTPCAQAIEDDARQLAIAPALIGRCLLCRTDIAHLRAGARTCGDACRDALSRLLRSRCSPVP